MRGTILAWRAESLSGAVRGGKYNGEHGIAEEAGCGDCREEFAEASVLSGLAGGLSAVQIGKRVIEKCSGTGPRLDRGRLFWAKNGAG